MNATINYYKQNYPLRILKLLVETSSQLLRQQMKVLVLKTLGTSPIYSLVSPPSLVKIRLSLCLFIEDFDWSIYGFIIILMEEKSNFE